MFIFYIPDLSFGGLGNNINTVIKGDEEDCYLFDGDKGVIALGLHQCIDVDAGTTIHLSCRTGQDMLTPELT